MDAAARAQAWLHGAQAAVCDVVEPWEHGTVLRATRHPTYWDYNLVRVEDDADIAADELLRIADEALAGLEHRQVAFEVVAAGERVRPRLEELGWKATRLVWMLHEGPLPDGTALTVEQVHYDTVRHLRLAWLEEDFPGVDVAGHLDEAREVDMRRSPQVFAAFEASRPVAFAQLDRDGEDAEISSVFVERDHRGRGLGTALTAAAIAEGADARDLWIVADADDRPKELYARLGFRPAWTLLQLLRLPTAAN